MKAHAISKGPTQAFIKAQMLSGYLHNKSRLINERLYKERNGFPGYYKNLLNTQGECQGVVCCEKRLANLRESVHNGVRKEGHLSTSL